MQNYPLPAQKNSRIVQSEERRLMRGSEAAELGPGQWAKHVAVQLYNILVEEDILCLSWIIILLHRRK